MATPLLSRASGFGSLFAIVESEHGGEALKLLRRDSGFALTTYSPSTLVPFPVMNRVYNRAAELSGDCQFGSRVGLTIRPEDFGPFVEYALCGEMLGDVIVRANVAQLLHSSDVDLDLRLVGDEARWRVRYRAESEPTVEHHAQRSLMQMLGTVSRFAGVRNERIEIHVAEPYAEEARLPESRLDIKVHPRSSDYEIAFPVEWLAQGSPIAGVPPDLAVEAMAAYRDRPLPRAMAEAVLVALELHEDLPRAAIGITAADFGLPARTLQHALKNEGVSYRDIVLQLRMQRAKHLLATTEMPLREIALATPTSLISTEPSCRLAE
jgi:AraC-like DNA-binding protein